MHIIADVNYELPVSFRVTKASASDMKQLKPMMKELQKKHPDIVETCKSLVADKGYDSNPNNKFLWDDYGIKPIIDMKGRLEGGNREAGGFRACRQHIL